MGEGLSPCPWGQAVTVLDGPQKSSITNATLQDRHGNVFGLPAPIKKEVHFRLSGKIQLLQQELNVRRNRHGYPVVNC